MRGYLPQSPAADRPPLGGRSHETSMEAYAVPAACPRDAQLLRRQPNPPMVFDEATQNLGPSATDTPTPPPAQDAQSGDGSNASIFSANPYDIPADDGFTPEDALGEENYIDPGLEGNGVNYVAPEGTVYPYAGSTPIPLDPVDAPTPTPRPELSFSYTPYTAAIGLTFEAPVGWLVDESVNEVFVLTEPVEQMKDNQQCVVTISAIPVTSNYTENNLKTEVTQRLSTISATNFAEWKPSLTATRYLMGSKAFTPTTAASLPTAPR